MARYPGAEWRPLATGHQAAMARYDAVVLHTMVGTLSSSDRYFHQNGWFGTESHFGVGGPWGDAKDGVVYQWGDTRYRADANLDGNHRIISIETGDNFPASASNIQPWTAKQLNSLAHLVAWICETHEIPVRAMPDSKPGSRGIGWHRLGIQHSQGVGKVPGFLVAGGERWSTSVGKECPGNARVAQIPGLIRMVQTIINPPKETAVDASDVWGVSRTLSEADANAYGDPELEGTKKSFGEIVRFPPAVSRLRREQNENTATLVDQMQQVETATRANTEALARIEKLLTPKPTAP